jgi:cilia- and flagella-associated protein 65
VDDALIHVPVIPALIPHASPLRLVDDVCTLGAVAYYTLCRRTCTLLLAADAPVAVRFAWRPEQQQPRHGDAQLAVCPADGVLQPGEQQTMQVTFYAGSTSQVLEHLLCCTITPYTSPAASKKGDRAVLASNRVGHRSQLSQPKPDSAIALLGCEEESLGLLLQARVMPCDDFESLYGKERLAAAYMPALYSSNINPLVSCTFAPSTAAAVLVPGNVATDETHFVKTLVDELIRTVVASPSVQGSFTALCPPRQASYAKMRVLRTATNDDAAARGSEKTMNAVDAPGKDPKGVPGNSTAAAFTERVMEELIREILNESVAAV